MDREGVPTAQVMSTDSITVSTETQIEDAVSTMREHGIGSLIVVDDQEELAGVITSNDFLAVISGNDTEGATVSEYMTKEVITIDPQDSIQTAAGRMITNGISHLPVETDDEGVIGMVSTTDITAYSVSRA